MPSVAVEADCGVTLDTLDDYAEYVFRQPECAVDEMVHVQVPRAEGLYLLIDQPVAADFSP